MLRSQVERSIEKELTEKDPQENIVDYMKESMRALKGFIKSNARPFYNLAFNTRELLGGRKMVDFGDFLSGNFLKEGVPQGDLLAGSPSPIQAAAL